MGKRTAVGIASAMLVVAGVATWLITGSSSGYRFEPGQAVYHQFSGDNALAHVAALVALGPRPAGSEALEASRVYLERELIGLGWATARQEFVEDTPRGKVRFVNLRARYPAEAAGAGLWEASREVLLGSHYDTKFYEEFAFVGANDGGSSTGALVEIARVTTLNPALAASLELVFFDGEEAFDRNITASDGLYGSRFYARQMRRWGEEQRPRFGLILDMIGDRQLNVGVPADSPYRLYQALMAAAGDLGYERFFGRHPSAILDDHVPLNLAGLPTLDIIDLDYEPWHTPGDTLDRVSAESLQVVGSTALLMVEKYLLGSGAAAR